MTIYDISEKAGVSIATVSRVLNGSTNVSEKTKNKVLAIIKECGYTPNAFARGLGLNTMQTIGILCADSSDSYLARAVYFLEQRLRANGYDSLLCCTGYDFAMKQKYLELLLSKKVDSVILVGSNFISSKDSDNDYIRLASKKIPVMLLNASFDHANVFCTLCDDFQGMYHATSTLLQEGRRRILYLYNSNSYSSQRKFSGYQSAMNDHKLFLEELTHYYSGNMDDLCAIEADLQQLTDSGIQYDAVIASEDKLAIGALKYALRTGKKIPLDLSIIGYNNSLLTQCCTPELTSVDSHLETLCNQLVITLMGVLEGNEMPKQTVFSSELMKKGTTL